MRNRRFAVAVSTVLAIGAAAALPAPSHATFHLMKISEVRPDLGGNADFLELKMHANGQNLVSGRHVAIYNAGAYFSGPFTLPSNVPNGQSQRTILIGNSGVPGADFVFAGLEIPSQGTACFLDNLGPTVNESDDVGVDCVSFGQSFAGAPSPTGTPTGTVPAGQSVHRTIARDCTTALDPADDTNNSVADFFFGAPTPRANRVFPTEGLCRPCGGQRGTIGGTSRRDVLQGTSARDVMHGAGGNDLLRGLRGNDILCGGPGKDKLVGGAGKDRLYGQGGPDQLIGGRGNDRLYGGKGNDRLVGGPGNDLLVGGPGKRDVCIGGPGKDRYRGCEIKR